MFQFSSLLQHLLLIYLQYNLSKTIVKLCFTVDLPYGIYIKVAEVVDADITPSNSFRTLLITI